MILRFIQYDKYNRGFGGKAPEDSCHLIIRVFLFRFCFFFFHRNKKEKVNISLSVGLAKPTYVFLIYISLFNQTLILTFPPRGRNITFLLEILLSMAEFDKSILLSEEKEHNFFTGKKQPLKIKTAFIIY